MNQLETNIVMRVLHYDGMIEDKPDAPNLRVFPNGDRRKRPAFWITDRDFRALYSHGALRHTQKGYYIAKSLRRRLTAGGAHKQHQDTSDQTVFVPGGVQREARINHRSNALERLARRRDRSGAPLLSTAEIEAGRALARDYFKAGEGRIATQNFGDVSVDGGDRNGAQERALLARMTARTRLTAARHAMGEGLDRAVIAVCCEDQSLDTVERAEGWAKSAGLTIFRLGLSRLVKLYGTESGRPDI